MKNEKQSIEVNIGELIFNGPMNQDHYVVTEAMQAELGRLMEERGIPANLTDSIDIAELSGGAFKMNFSSGARLGIQIAGSIYKSLRGR